jgi:hypothetical protein
MSLNCVILKYSLLMHYSNICKKKLLVNRNSRFRSVMWNSPVAHLIHHLITIHVGGKNFSRNYFPFSFKRQRRISKMLPDIPKGNVSIRLRKSLWNFNTCPCTSVGFNQIIKIRKNHHKMIIDTFYDAWNFFSLHER